MTELIVYPSKHFSSRGARRVGYVIVHTTQTPRGGTPVGTLRYLEKNDRQASCHELVVPGAVYRMVPDELAAHHVGYGTLPNGVTGLAANQESWGIELFNFGQQKPYVAIVTTGIARVVEACKRFELGADRVLGHREVDPTRRSDPDGIDMDWFRGEIAKGLQQQAPDPIAATIRLLGAGQMFELNFDAALLKAILRDGFNPVSPEQKAFISGAGEYIVQIAVRPGQKRVYYVPDGQWDKVKWVAI